MSKTHTSLKQEQFVIPDDKNDRRKIVRQDRIPVPEKKVFLLINKNKIEVLNVSSFGISTVVTEEDSDKITPFFEKGEVLEAILYFEDIEIQTITIRLVRNEPFVLSVFKDRNLGFEVTGQPISIDCIKAMELTDNLIQSTKDNYNESQDIPNDFKLLVYEMKDFLDYLRTRISEIEKNAPNGSESQNSDFRLSVTQMISDYLSNIIPNNYRMIPKMLENVDENTMQASTKFIRHHLGSFIYRAPFAQRAFYKPLGYAGDFEMMNHLYRGESVGETLFDQCMHRYLIEEPAAQAVKNRSRYLLQKIFSAVEKSKNEKIRVLAVASGPAKEIQLFLNDNFKFKNKKIEFVCIDQDAESLKHAQKEILSIERFAKTGHQFKFLNLAIKNILVNGLPENNFDLIYTAGLFDYFTDSVAISAAKSLYNGLAESGELIIGNFCKSNPTRALMEIILDWHLIYRTRDDLLRIFGQIGKTVEIEQEQLGINLFALINK